MIIFRLVGESFRFAWNALKSNILRTLLSLLGVTIGIFAIIAVFTVVDSLERQINESLSFLGRTNMDVRRFPFEFGNVPWWEYIKRPYANYNEYEFLSDNVKNAEGITIFAVRNNVQPKYASNSVSSVNCLGVAYSHKDVYAFKDIKGRYFTQQEAASGQNVMMIGHNVKKELFGSVNALGKQVKLKGRKYSVIGVLPEEGEGILGNTSNDDNIYIPYKAFSKIYYVGKGGVEPIISAKGSEDDIGLVKLEYEMKGILRKVRGLKPKEKDSFSLVRQQAILNTIGGFFDALSFGGILIGGFAILVGGFGIANIMFVSVSERTSIIGLQKSLGAKNYFILFQFLFESIFLAIVGGGIGIFIVFLLSFVELGSLELVVTTKNIVIGMGVSTVIGTVSGIVPAIKASRMDPV
ncbi:MAG: ABC transporter permease, partial [Bacteroidota bacterium]